MYEITEEGGILKKLNEIWCKVTEPLQPQVPQQENTNMKSLSYPFSREKIYLWVLYIVLSNLESYNLSFLSVIIFSTSISIKIQKFIEYFWKSCGNIQVVILFLDSISKW